MATKPIHLPSMIISLLFWSYGVQAALYLQIGDKCQEEKGNSFSNYDDLNNSSSITGIDSFSGSEIASAICDPAIPLECLSGRCQCRKGYTINRNGTRCLEVARNGLNSSCEENIQCWKSLLGRMSECDIVTGKCRCYESESLPIVFHHGRCNYGESLGEFCQIDGLCEATTPNATCRSGTCQCKDGYVPGWDKSRCLPIALGLNSTCEENIQCEKSQLGALSECNQEIMKCNCYRIPDMDTVFYRGRCYFEAGLGDVCQVTAQCQKKTPNSVCSRDGKCLCDDGYISNGNNTLCLAIPSSDGAVVTTTAVLASVPEATGGNGNINGNNDNNNNANEECLEDAQCFRLLGPYSRCNAVKHKCECFFSENFHMRFTPTSQNNNMHVTNDNSVITSGAFSKNTFMETLINESGQIDLLNFPPSLVMIGRKCYLSKYLGQLCKFNKQCSAVTENSWCDNGRCKCLDETHTQSEDGRKCLKIAQKGLDSVCDEDAQCSRSELGLLSRCNLDKKKCECSNNVMPVVYYKGKCYFHRQLGSSCQSNVECQAGSSYLAECSLGRCRCQNGTVRLSSHACGFNKSVANYASKNVKLLQHVVLSNGIIFAGTLIIEKYYLRSS